MVFNNSSEISVEQVLRAIENPDVKKEEYKIQDLKIARANFEKDFILKALEENDWKILETADILGIDRTNLFKKMKRYGIQKN